MIRLDQDLLASVGLGELPPDTGRLLLQHVYDTLEMRVGCEIAARMTDDQLAAFSQLIDAEAERAVAVAWLDSNLPEYKRVVQEQFDRLRAELSAFAPTILADERARAGVPA